ncbi:MAG: DUF6089 family protein [Bacteroidota bacterium]
MCISGLSFGQISEIGFGLGGFSYSGDLTRGYSITSNRPAGTAYFRSNLSDIISFKAAITAGNISASDDNPIDPFAEMRGAEFSIFVFEASTTFEYHFLDWRSDNAVVRWTPYFFVGFGVFGISGEGEKTSEYSNVQPAIPIGVGFKYTLNPRWYLGLEFGARKTFFDYIDNVSEGDLDVKNFQYGNEFDNDTYYFLGLSLTYSFYNIPCPTSPYR